MQPLQLTKFEVTGTLAQEFQAVETKFAFVNANYEQITAPAICRDFLGDCLWGKATNNYVAIWRFQYDWKEKPYDTEVLRLSVTFPNKQVKKHFETNYSYLAKKEEIAKTTFTKCLKTQDPLIYVLEADKAWQSAVWKISLYTFYIKIMCYENMEQLARPEKDYVIYLKQNLELKMLERITDTYVEWADRLDVNHCNRGFLSVLKGDDKKTYNYIFGKQT
jgi:hypothetical protein